jgi:hypothetical protein
MVASSELHGGHLYVTHMYEAAAWFTPARIYDVVNTDGISCLAGQAWRALWLANTYY